MTNCSFLLDISVTLFRGAITFERLHLFECGFLRRTLHTSESAAEKTALKKTKAFKSHRAPKQRDSFPDRSCSAAQRLRRDH